MVFRIENLIWKSYIFVISVKPSKKTWNNNLQRSLDKYAIFAIVQTSASTNTGYFAGAANFCGIDNKMAPSCHGICQRLNIKSVTRISYDKGQKYCTHCGCFFKFEGVRCPCCSTVMRTKPRTRSAKLKQQITSMR